MASNTPSEDFTVVGIGASAGGLEALTELLKYLPANTGLAFVVVQHLDPRHESILGELLANRTLMPVVQIHADTPVEPNRVYVIPPNARMIIKARVLSLQPRPPGAEQHRPIDAFFISLAADLGTNAVGIVLSGIASDGTLGLESIKAESGITFAQDESARFDSMPRSAIAAGVVDFVLPPHGIADELTALSRRLNRTLEAGAESFDAGPAFHRILNLLRANTGVDFSFYKQATISRRLMRRIVVRSANDLDHYLQILRAEPREAEALFNDLLINVTEFFRDPQVFEAMKTISFPFIVRDHTPSDPIRCWVPGCSSGEEVYSITIALIEYLESKNLDFPIQMFGTDISDSAIDKARAGIFDGNTVARLSPERLRRFFAKTTAGYQISRHVRDLCIFSRHNIGKDPPLSRMNLISCRNLLIYFAPSLQKRVLSTFGYALQPAGCLILGPSESLGSLADRFTTLDNANRIYCRKADLTRAAFDLSENIADYNVGPARPVPLRRDHATRFSGNSDKYIDQMLLSRFRASGLVLDRTFRIVDSRGDVSPFLKSGAVELNADVLESVELPFAEPLRNALLESQNSADGVRLDKISVRQGNQLQFVQVIVMPFTVPGAEPHTLALFEIVSAPAENPPQPPTANPLPRPLDTTAASPPPPIDLEQELVSTRQYLQSIIEELRSTNEEAQSSNEELQSTNEELQTAKEELQSSNEELNTVNVELQSRNIELSHVNDDLLNLLSSMNMPVVMMGSDLRIRRFTPMAERVLHLIAADVGRPISDLKPRINVPNLEEILQNVLDTLVAQELEVQDQEGRCYLMRVRPYRTSDNRIEGAVLQLLDISELKRSLEEVKRARDYAQTIFDTIREPVLVLDGKLAIQKANQSFYEFLDLRDTGELGMNIADVGRGALASPRIRQILDEVVSRDTPLSDIEVDIERKRGEPRTIALNAKKLKSPENTDLLLLAFQDVTEKNREAEAKYRRLFETAKDGIVIIDALSGDITDLNPYVEQLLGYPREELVGRKLWDAEPLRNTPDVRGAVEQIRDVGVVRYQDLALKTRDGGERHTEVVANTYSEKDRRLIQLNIRDLTERKKFERELQHTQKLESLGLLAGGIAHDFNNLLTGILGNASLAYSDVPMDDPIRIQLREIMDASERAAFLTRQMLAYAGQGRYVTHTIHLGDLVREISVLIRTSIPKHVELSLDLPSETPPIEADPGQIQQLIMNLVINGAEAVPTDKIGRVDVRTTARQISDQDIKLNFVSEQLTPGLYVSLEIRDNGSGMDEATRSRIFDPFFTTKFTGRGLGLAAALGIVKGHHGAIRVYSSPGHGTTFHVVFPAATGTLKPRTPPTRARFDLPTRGLVLVIDDEELIRNLTRSILVRRGFQVITAENGLQGVELFREKKDLVSLIILDLLMPVMNGEEALDRLRDIRPDVPILLSTGFDESEAARRFPGKPVAGFIHKPYNIDRLIQAIEFSLTGAARPLLSDA